jgi:hypothetical protein
MGDIRYGLVEGFGKGREIRLTKSVYFHRKGGHFVRLAAGYATLCASGATEVMGWAESPKHATGYDAWKGSDTKGADKLFIVYADPDNVFELPVGEAKASLAASYIGRGAGIITSGSTYTLVQKAQLGANAASQLSIVDVNLTQPRTVMVKVKAGNRQAI